MRLILILFLFFSTRAFAQSISQSSPDIVIPMPNDGYYSCIAKTLSELASIHKAGWSLDTAFDAAVDSCKSFEESKKFAYDIEMFRGEILDSIEDKLHLAPAPTHRIVWDRLNDPVSGKTYGVALIRAIHSNSVEIAVQCMNASVGDVADFNIAIIAGERYRRDAKYSESYVADVRFDWNKAQEFRFLPRKTNDLLYYGISSTLGDMTQSAAGHLAASLLSSKRILIRIDGRLFEFHIADAEIPEGLSKTCNFPGE